MRKEKWIGTYLLFLSICLCLLSACGKDDVYQAEAGIDGYVYVAQKLQTGERLETNIDIKAAGEYLYYARSKEDGNGIVIERLNIQEQTPPEIVMTLSFVNREMQGYILEELQEKLSSFDAEDGETPIWAVAADGSLIDMSKVGCRFYLQDFDVDAEGNLYCQEQVLIGKNFEYKSMGATLSKWNCDGEKVYQNYYQDMSGFDLCGDGEVCVLGEGRIILVDKEGIQAGEISTEQYWGDEEPLSQNLLRDAEWHAYYALRNSRGIDRGFEVLTDEGLQFQEMEESFNAVGGNTECVCVSSARKLFYGASFTDILYEYDVESGSKGKVLNWIDSGFLSMNVRSIAQISSGELLVNYESDIYLLTKTPVEELPERETIVLFSYEPTSALKETVLQFNKESDKYRIAIDDYGMEYSWVTRQGDATRVDMAVVSQTPPDILDMTFLDVHKYAQKGVLEDLLPYLEESSILNREDFLENALEGMTIDGCLTCIPNEFREEWLIGRKRQLGTLERWDMEEVYKLSESYPESAHRLIGDILGNLKMRDYVLNTFCGYYCLEEFIEWENGECRFDSEEFIRLLKWVQEYAEGNPDLAYVPIAYIPYIEEEVLLFYDVMGNYESMSGAEVRCGDETILMGFPSADGEGVYPVYVRDALAITANSPHKEGAWAFLEYFLSTSEPSPFGLSTKKDCIYEGVQNAALQEFISDEIIQPEGTERRIAKSWVSVGGEMVPCYAISQEQADALMKAIESADFTPRSDKEKMILRIISEEAESYYNGDKSIEEVTRIIQNRVGLILQE